MKMLTNYGTYIYFHFIKVANATAAGIHIEEINIHPGRQRHRRGH
jgi:hypothetical protein